MAKEDLDDLSKFENEETSKTVPPGYWLLFFGLVGWGVYYLWAYSPWGSGWTQAGDVEGKVASLGANTFATILFTALPATAAVVLMMVQAGRKK